MELPKAFVERMNALLGEAEASALCAALETDEPTSVRLHPLRATQCSHLEVADAVPWSERGRYLKRRPSFTLDAAFHGGAYYVQEASSQFVERLLPADVEGCRLLDLCAAPGGKSTLYATKVGREGLVVANEIDRKRAQVLCDNVRKWGLGNVAVTSTDADHLAVMAGWFDVVAVDAPCSGEGMFRKDDRAREEWSEQNVRLCAARQDEILEGAWQTLRAGGTLIYSTCTFNHEEDEGTLERFVERVGEEVVEAPEVVCNPEWGIVVGRVGAFQTFHFYPHRTKGEGFFAAVARKSDEARSSGRLPKAKRSIIAQVDKPTQRELERWVTAPDKMQFGVAGECCYAWYRAQAEAVRRLSELVPVLYSGVAMGQLFKGKLKPDQALAHFVELNRSAVAVADLSEEESLAYLRKQELHTEGLQEGLNLMCYAGLPLGFAKRIGGRVNNLYPTILRILKGE